jgi:hypothetical protein
LKPLSNVDVVVIQIQKCLRLSPVAYVPYKNHFLALWSFHFDGVQNAGGCSDGSWPLDGGTRFPSPDALNCGRPAGARMQGTCRAVHFEASGG